MISVLVNCIVVALSLYAFSYLLVSTNEAGFEFLWALPLVFVFCYPLLSKAIKNCRMVLFFIAFTCVAFLRYVVNPFLLCYTGNYFGPIMSVLPSVDSLHIAVFLMIYELIVCSLLIYFLSKRNIFSQNNLSGLVLPQSYFIYVLFIFFVCVLVALNPSSLYFFSFGIWGMNELNLSTLTPMAQATIMFVITAKFVLFWVLMCVIKSKYEVSKYPFFWKSLGFVVAFVFGFIYYGGNRAQFLFSLITSLYIFILLFPNLKKYVIVLSLIFGSVVVSFMTTQRNYFDYYSYERGTQKKALVYSLTTTSYFGGITNVAVGVEMANRFSEINKGSQLFKDVFLPIVGLNKLLPFENKESSNNLFNYVFFNSKKYISQILPSIAHGYFMGGLVFCVIIDVAQILFVFFLLVKLKKTNRMELVFIFNLVLFRFSLMFGQNLTQQINGIAMQLVLPLCVYWLNNRVVLIEKKIPLNK